MVNKLSGINKRPDCESLFLHHRVCGGPGMRPPLIWKRSVLFHRDGLSRGLSTGVPAYTPELRNC